MDTDLQKTFSLLFQAHPWHGVAPGKDTPNLIKSFIEIVPSDTVKYELDKPSGHLKVDRPQRFSSLCPSLYGFVPQSYCGMEIANLCMSKTGKTGIKGDGDPLDICVLSERGIPNGNILLNAIPIGGLLMIDNNEADDKIIAVLEGDVTFGELTELDQVPGALIDRLRHYFLSYKQIPGDPPRIVEISEVYNKARAYEVINASLKDYKDMFGEPADRLGHLRQLLRT
jgi:inorganic pyrophosphatase